MSEFKVKVRVNGHIGVLEWQDQVDASTLQRAISLAADDVLIGHRVRRVEVSLPAPDVMARRAVLRAGFRQEGIRREALATDDGHVDVVLYSRLAGDLVTGQPGFSAVMNSVLPTKRVIAHCLFQDEQSRVLLCQTQYKPDFELPGGVVEQQESPRVGVIREVAEEIGFQLTDPELVMVDWLPPFLGWDDALQFLYRGGTLTGEQVAGLRRQESEIAALHWLHPEEIVGRVSERSASRISRALNLAAGEFRVLEAGDEHPDAPA